MAIQFLRGPEKLNPSTSDVVLQDGQPFYSKHNKQLYIGDGDSPVSDLLPITSYLYADTLGEESISQLSHNAVNDEGGENVLDPLQVNITTGRSSFTNGQKNRNGGYFSIVTGQNNALPRLFDQTLPDGTVVKKWRSSSSNIVGGTGNFVTGGSSITLGTSNQNAGGNSIVVGKENQDWTTGSTTEDTEKLQASIEAYRLYSLYGANSDGYILDKTGDATTTRLSDLTFPSTGSSNSIIGGASNIGKSANSIISGKGNFVASSESFVTGMNNKLYHKTYAGTTSATESLYTYYRSNVVLGNNNELKGRYNKIIGDRNIAITADGSTDYRQNLKIIGNDNTVNSDDKIIIGNNITDPTRSITLGNGAEAIGISSDNIVYLDNARVTNAPTKDTSVIRKIDITDSSMDGKFNSIKLARRGSDVKLEFTDAIRAGDICTVVGGTTSTGATYAALDVKFASIKMKETTGKDGNNGSTVILPDEITTTTFKGNLIGLASKATADKNGNDIVDTYATKDMYTHLSENIDGTDDRIKTLAGAFEFENGVLTIDMDIISSLV